MFECLSFSGENQRASFYKFNAVISTQPKVNVLNLDDPKVQPSSADPRSITH